MKTLFRLACILTFLAAATAPGLDARAQEAEPLSPQRQIEQQLADLKLQAKVQRALGRAGAVRAFSVEVEVDEGEVTLSGNVRTLEQRDAAEALARDLPGVTRVENTIRVDGRPVLTQGTIPSDPSRTGTRTPAQPASGQYHTVERGDSLWTIAQQYNTSIAQLKRLNDLRSNTIRQGQRLRVR